MARSIAHGWVKLCPIPSARASGKSGPFCLKSTADVITSHNKLHVEAAGMEIQTSCPIYVRIGGMC